MISDLFPELLGAYHQATQKATEREMLEFVIQHDLVNRMKHDIEEDVEELIEQRIKAAYKCLDRFYPVDADQSYTSDQSQSSEDGIQSGKMCEDSCIDFLTSEYNADDGHHSDARKRIVLQNVYVNSRRSKESSKYVPPKVSKNGQPDPKDKLDGTGIIWSDNTSGAGRHRLCSEFDAVVLSEMSDARAETTNTYLSSIWEAKKTISPSTLHDILSKKLGAIQTLVDDPTAELVYGDGFTTKTIPFAAEERKFTFGVYGTELQKAENASDSIRSIAGSYVISSDIREIIRALDRIEIVDSVLVEVELESALSIVSSLRALVEEIQMRDGVEVVLILEEPAHI